MSANTSGTSVFKKIKNGLEDSIAHSKGQITLETKEWPQKDEKDKKTKHGRVMITTDGIWTVWRFEFDVNDGKGVAWQCGRGTGPSNSVENSSGHFTEKGYTVIPWEDV